MNTTSAGPLRSNAATMLRRTAFVLALVFSLSGFVIAQENPYHIKEVISREFGINVGADSVPDIKEIVSREHSFFVGMGPDNQVISREYSVVLVDAEPPPIITLASHTAAPDGSWVTLNWSAYNQWTVRDVDHYRVYYSDRAFSNVSGRVPLAIVRGETQEFTAVGLPILQDHFFAIVPVDALGNHFEDVRYFGIYILTQEIISREVGLFVGGEPDPPYREAVSREYSVVITDAEPPPIVQAVTMTVSPLGDTVTLDWSSYNQWAARDVAHYAIYYSAAGAFHDVTGMTPLRIVPGEQFSTTFTGLAEWRDHFFAVVPVDGLGHFEPNILYRAAYVLMPEVITREFGLFVGAEPDPPYRQVVSREYSIVIGGSETPAPVTGLGSGFTARASQSQYGGIDLDWTHYNEWAQRDVAGYRIYVDTQFFDDVTGRPVYAYSANGAQVDTITGLACEQIYHVAVVAADVLGNFSTEVYSFSSKVSVCELGDVLAFTPTPIHHGVRLDWDLGGVGTDLHFFVDHFRIYLDDSVNPVVVPGHLRTYTFMNLVWAVEHQFRLTTVDLEGTESSGQIVSARPLNATRDPEPPRVVQDPLSGHSPAGFNHTFSVEATGTVPLNYQWRKDGIDLPGATRSTLTLSRVRQADAGVYSVEVRNRWGRVRSLPAELRIGQAPKILAGPRDQIVRVGEDVSFHVEAHGTPPLAYQWRKDGVALPGATNPRLRLPGVTSAQAGYYQVEISNPITTVLSAWARLQVFAPPGIVSGPVSQVLEPGQTLVLSVVASGDEPLQYQWLLNGTRLEGETGPTLRIDNAQWENSGRYSVVVANAVGAVESDPAEVQIGTTLLGLTDAFEDRPAYVDLAGIGRGTTIGATRQPGEPAHAGWPQGASVWLGWLAPDDGILHVSTEGSGFDTLLAIYTGDQVGGLSLVASDDDGGPHLTSYLAVNVTAGTVYNLVVDGRDRRTGSVVLAWALEVSSDRLPVIVSGPDSFTVGPGDPAMLEVQALPAHVGYQWFKDGLPIPEATGTALVFDAVTPADVGNYQVLVTLGMQSVLSPVAALQNNLTDGAVVPEARGRDKFAQPGRSSGTIAPMGRGPRRQDFLPPVRGWIGLHRFSTVGHRKEPGEPNHGGRVGGASAWYSIHAERSGRMLVTTGGSSFDTVLAVYSGPPFVEGFDELTLLGEDDNSGPDGVSSQVVIEVIKNGVYHVAVDGVNGATGQVELRYEIGRPPNVVRGLEPQRPLVGQPLALSVTVASDVAVTYEWWRDGVLVAQTSEGTLDLGAAGSAAAGEYMVRVSNHAGEQTVGPVQVQVLGPDVLRFGAGTGPVAEGYRLEVERPLAGRLVVERSWDLETWEPVWSDAPLNEVVEWIDPVASDNLPRFYRTRLLPDD